MPFSLQWKAIRDGLDLQNLVATLRVIELSNKEAALIEEKDKQDHSENDSDNSYN